ncbi:MAG TPA: YdcF family protein, partial [Coleofasciculaceae cyanobacterium]
GAMGKGLMATKLIFEWLIQPLLVLPLFLLLIQLLGNLSWRQGRRVLRLLLGGFALLYLLLLFPPTISFAETALIDQIPQDSGQPADAIVILGRGNALTPSRVEVAAQLWDAHRAPLIFVSGAGDAPVIVQQLQDKGIPRQALGAEECSRTTYENAKFTAAALKPQGIKRILLVTDAPHMLRSLLTFQNVGFTVTPIPSSTLSGIGRGDRTKIVLHEYGGLLSYSLMGRFPAKQVMKMGSLAPKRAAQQL